MGEFETLLNEIYQDNTLTLEQLHAKLTDVLKAARNTAEFPVIINSEIFIKLNKKLEPIFKQQDEDATINFLVRYFRNFMSDLRAHPVRVQEAVLEQVKNTATNWQVKEPVVSADNDCDGNCGNRDCPVRNSEGM